MCLAVTASLAASSLALAASGADDSVNSECAFALVAGESQTVTVSQWCDFLNAVATTSDPHGLYDSRMESLIVRFIMPDGFSYCVVSGQEDTPIRYVRHANQERYANWLQNGQPSGEEGVGITETESYILADPCPFPAPGKPGPSSPVPGEPAAPGDGGGSGD